MCFGEVEVISVLTLRLWLPELPGCPLEVIPLLRQIKTHRHLSGCRRADLGSNPRYYYYYYYSYSYSCSCSCSYSYSYSSSSSYSYSYSSSSSYSYSYSYSYYYYYYPQDEGERS